MAAFIRSRNQKALLVVECATTGAITLSTALVAGQSIDGITLVDGDLVLVKDQASASANGVYSVTAAGGVRAGQASTSRELDNLLVVVSKGTTNANTIWHQTVDDPVVGTDSVTFARAQAETLALADLSDVSAKTGTGSTVVMQGSPTITTPVVAGFGVGSKSTNVGVEINAQTDSYTLVLADAGKLVTLNKATAITLTVPANSSVAYQVGDQIQLAQLGAGQVTVAGAGGVTINAPNGKLKLAAQYSEAVLTKTATDTWLLAGDITA